MRRATRLQLLQQRVSLNAANGLRCQHSQPIVKQHDTTSIQSILIANRGEIALRVGRTAALTGIRTTTLYTDPDRESQHALSSPYAINLGSTDQYLNGARIVELAKQNQCQAIHPGYGFLSENADFAKACTDAGLVFIGPPWQAIESMGDKATSKRIMIDAGVPCIPGYHGSNQDSSFLAEQADKIGYPVLLKAVKGGGGKGMRIALTPDEFQQQLESAKRESKSSFGDDVMLVEKYIATPRHIEVQIFADKYGNCVALGERDCSIQRRHQKVLEESPAPNLPEDIRQDLWQKARQAALAVDYEGAGTVEFIFDNDSGQFFFMEMNTRLQVEHPVTEMVTGLDLVQWQISIAEGHPLPLTQEQVHKAISERGHAIEARIYAEDPAKNFLPSTGVLHHLKTPRETQTVRIDAGFVQGDEVSSHYDPMIAKLIVSAPTRRAALQKLEQALSEYQVAGVVTNIDFLKRCVTSSDFVNGEIETGYISKHAAELFASPVVTFEIMVQAAVALFETAQDVSKPISEAFPTIIGFDTSTASQVFHLKPSQSARENYSAPGVSVRKMGFNDYQVSNLDTGLSITISSTYDPVSRTVSTYFPDRRLEATVISIPADPATRTATQELSVFQQGEQYRLALQAPKWSAKALGEKATDNSVLAPMPCKILRVEVAAGDAVHKGQSLVVIESMKMETVIRAPSDAVVKRVMRAAGEMAKAGIALVEFEVDTGS